MSEHTEQDEDSRIKIIQSKQILKLTEMGINPKIIKLGNVTMGSSQHIVIKQLDKISIINISTYDITTFYITADSAIMSPSNNSLALRLNQTVKIFNLDTKTIIKTFEASHPILYLKWLDAKRIVFATFEHVYHWTIDDDTKPTKTMDVISTHESIQFIDYGISTDNKWVFLQGITKNPTDHSVEGALQLYNVAVDRYSPMLNGYGSGFVNISIDGRNVTLLCFSKRKKEAEIIFVEPVLQQNAKLLKICGHIGFKSNDDYIISMVPCLKYGCVYFVSHQGIIFLCDIETGVNIVNVSAFSAASNTKVILAISHIETNGLLILDSKGDVTLFDVDRENFIPFMKYSLGNTVLAQPIAKKYNLPGLDDEVPSKYGRMSDQEIEQIVKDAEQYKEEHKMEREVMKSMNELECLMYTIKNTVSDIKYIHLITNNDRDKLRDLSEITIEWIYNGGHRGNRTKEDYDDKRKEVEEIWKPIISEADNTAKWMNIEAPKDATYYFDLLGKERLNIIDSINFCHELLKFGEKAAAEEKIEEYLRGNNKLTASEELGDVLLDYHPKLASISYYQSKVPYKAILGLFQMGRKDAVIRYCKEIGYKPKWTELLRKIHRLKDHDLIPFSNQLMEQNCLSEHELMKVLQDLNVAKSTIHCVATKYRRELIISGYIRNIELSLSLIVPYDILPILFTFYEYRCDFWSKQKKTKTLHVSYDYIRYPAGCSNIFYSSFGSHILKNGNCYEWKLKFVRNIKYAYVGLICDDEDLMERYKNEWNWYQDNEQYAGYVYNFHHQKFYYSEDIHSYKNYGSYFKRRIGLNADLIEMKVDLTNNNSSISFVLNGKDDGIAYDKIDKNYNYRLAVCAHHTDIDAELQLL